MAAPEFVSVRRIGDVRAALISSGELHYRPPFDGLDWVTDDTVIDADGLAMIGINALYAEVGDAVLVIDPSEFAPGTVLPRARLLTHPGIGSGLAELGVDPASVTHVLITHLHPDHLNGIVVDGPDGVRLRFPNAEHVLPALDWRELVLGGEGGEAEEVRELLAPVRRAGLVRDCEERYEVDRRVRLTRTGGESPGHQIVEIDTGTGSLVYLGDLVHYPVEVAHFDWSGARGRDEEALLAARQRLLGTRAAAGAVFVFTHGRFPAWGTVEPDAAGGRRWRYLD